MSEATVLERVLRRERIVVAVALAILVFSSWSYVLWLAGNMDMGASGLEPMLSSSFTQWSISDFLFMFVMWAVMMIGMMTPSAAPMILIYARVGRQAKEQGIIFASTAWFALGYLLTWTAFSLLATFAQWVLERAALLTPMMTSASPIFGGLILVAAGLYQWSPVKDACLFLCQAPIVFVQRHGGFRRNARGALYLGLRHGAYCVGCCWVLMALLFVGGVMNVLWIATLAFLVLAEKVIPVGRILSRGAGVVLVAAGIWMLV
jgi:predicted metal-binding membrane protein